MKQTTLLLGVLVVLAGGYLLFFYDAETPSTEASEEVSGVAVEVDLEGAMVDGPALVTIEDEGGKRHVMAVPSMGLPLCAAFENIADVYTIEPGDTVSVKGDVNAADQIIPCESADHYLTVVSSITNTEVGYEFSYTKSPNGYVVVQNTQPQDENFVSGVMLFDRAEYEVFLASTEPREGPPAIGVRVYENPEQLDAPVWVSDKPLESNISLALGDPEEVVVGEANAVHYVADGLFPLDTYVVAHAGNIYVLTVMYPDEASRIYLDFQDIVSDFEFIRTPDQE